jgi:hypothetical protein
MCSGWSGKRCNRHTLRASRMRIGGGTPFPSTFCLTSLLAADTITAAVGDRWSFGRLTVAVAVCERWGRQGVVLPLRYP